MKFTKFKKVASKLLKFSSQLPLTHCLFNCLPERGHVSVLWIYWQGCRYQILKCEWPTALQTMICFSRAEQLHDATLSFTFLVHSCQLTQQHEAANPVLDPRQLCLRLQWWYYKGLHRHYQKEEKMEQTGHETASWWWPQTPISDRKISHDPTAMRNKQADSLQSSLLWSISQLLFPESVPI